jgi:molecular chaperone GrpE
MSDQTSVPPTPLQSDAISEANPEIAPDDALLRLQADFINYKRRTETLARTLADQTLGDFVRELLVVLDALDIAQEHVISASEYDPVHRLLRDSLRTSGLETLDPLGDEFDPTVHDALEMSDASDHIVVSQVLRRGYRWRGQLLRPAMVILGAKSG